jgi:hypothetical protein
MLSMTSRKGPAHKHHARVVALAAAIVCSLAALARPAAAQRPGPDDSAAARTRPAVPAGAPGAPAAAPAAPPVTLPPNYDAAGSFYDGASLHDIHLAMKADDWETLKANYLLDTYYPADFSWRNVRVPVVGVRSRGAGSRNAGKPSLRLDFNRYVADQKFLKLSAMILANAYQDASMVNRRLSMTVFAAMELPAPRVVHARLFVNGEYIGLYEVVEAIEKAFLARAFGWDSTGKHRRDNGYLFEYRWDGDFDWSYPGPDLARYAELFESKNHELEAPSVLYGPIEDMFRTLNEVTDRDFEAEVGRYLYLAVFIRHLAVERFTSDIDGFLGDWGPNNFYLYRFEGQTLSAVVPWDKDSTFYDVNDGIYRGFERTILGQRILSLPSLKRLYLESLLDCASTMALPAAPGSSVSWLEAELLRERAQTIDAARADANKPYTNERLDDAHQKLLDFARNRSAVVIDLARRELGQLAEGVK